MRVAIIGGGVMGEALTAALLTKGVAQPSHVAVCDVLEQRRQHLASTYGVAVHQEAAAVLEGAHIAVLAVKPQEFPALATSLRGRLSPGQTVLSIMAGVPMASLMQGLGHEKVVRAMPNTPAQIGAGATVWVASPKVGPQEKEEVRRVLGALGLEMEVEHEKYVDMATAVSGSGPGFVFLLLEAFVEGAVAIGMPRAMAVQLVLQTFVGSVRYAQQTGRHLAELRAQVTSPGGTTAAGILALEKAAVRGAIMEAIQSAYRKARELAEGGPLTSS
jgi:pyrroline-5-carboxylate reductase